MNYKELQKTRETLKRQKENLDKHEKSIHSFQEKLVE